YTTLFRSGIDAGLLRHGGETTDGGLDGAGEVRGVHRHGDVEGPQVAGDVLTDLVVGEIIVVGRRGGDLQDLGAQVRVGDATLDRVGGIHGVLIHDVRVTGLELDLSQGLEELTGVDLGLADAVIIDH